MPMLAVLPLPWQWGHKSCLPLLHGGAVIYACLAGLVNFFFLMCKIRHSKGVSGSLRRCGLLSDPPVTLLLVPETSHQTCTAQPGPAELWTPLRRAPKA